MWILFDTANCNIVFSISWLVLSSKQSKVLLLWQHICKKNFINGRCLLGWTYRQRYKDKYIFSISYEYLRIVFLNSFSSTKVVGSHPWKKTRRLNTLYSLWMKTSVKWNVYNVVLCKKHHLNVIWLENRNWACEHARRVLKERKTSNTPFFLCYVYVPQHSSQLKLINPYWTEAYVPEFIGKTLQLLLWEVQACSEHYMQDTGGRHYRSKKHIELKRNNNVMWGMWDFVFILKEYFPYLKSI